ncbi:hypothetical protein BDZ89DRAFT_1064660 [Hymenopellis radicata]|nr:hypothetical protein BDZ89DRAFT_1064660 [Hymenopellis radicata]
MRGSPQRSARLERQDQTAIPFHHLSVSNLPPTVLELSDIQTTILPVLDQDILSVDAAIWSEIFLYAHSLDSDLYLFDWPSRTIWQLSQVCQTWRDLALSLHSCWSSVVLHASSEWQGSERDVEILAFVLERSHQHSLDITLCNFHPIGDSPFLRRMREKVFAESHRWRTARLDWHYDEVRPDLLHAPLRGRLPQLELLDFAFPWDMDSDISAFKDCPHLVNVTLRDGNPRMVELPVKQIACLRLSNLEPYCPAGYVRGCVDLLSQCPWLEILCVVSQEPVQDPFQQSIILPCIRDLSAIHPYLLDSLTLPQLEVATLDGGDIDSEYPDTLYSFYCLIQRSNCASNLTELRINEVPLTLHHSEPHLLLSILSQTTKLATLQLRASMFNFQENIAAPHDVPAPDDWSVTQIMDVMSALEVVPVHTATFLPRLVSLDITVNDHSDLHCIPYPGLAPHDDFVAALNARHAGNEAGLSKLEKFHFALYTTPRDRNPPEMYELRRHEALFHGHDASVLRGLCEDGMDLLIQFDGIRGFDQ